MKILWNHTNSFLTSFIYSFIHSTKENSIISSIIAVSFPSEEISSLVIIAYQRVWKTNSSDPNNNNNNELQEKKVTDFFPNSLVIVGWVELLESIASCKCDSSSSEMLNIILDLFIIWTLWNSYSYVKIHFIFNYENAAILFHIVIKNRKETASLLQEETLSDRLVLKYFYNIIFSPSTSQRFISIFLCSSWMCDAESTGVKNY